MIRFPKQEDIIIRVELVINIKNQPITAMVSTKSKLTTVEHMQIQGKNQEDIKTKARRIAIENNYQAFKIESVKDSKLETCYAEISFLLLEK